MNYSIVIPHLSNSNCIDQCIASIQANSYYTPEIVTVVDESDVYYAFNKGVYTAKHETVVLLNDDMFVAKNWDYYIPKYNSPDTLLVGYVIEPNPGNAVCGRQCIKYDCGTTAESFQQDKFQEFVNILNFAEAVPNGKGWYMPLVVNQKTFVTYPNIKKFPNSANDAILLDMVLPPLGYKFLQIKMFVYHLGSNSLK